jgi:hypothetical protein
MKLGPRLTLAAAEGVAIQALTFLAGEPERLAGFLNTTGLNPEEIRAASAQPGFLLGVLDYVGCDDRLVAEFAAATGCNPGDVARAYEALGGAPWEREIP